VLLQKKKLFSPTVSANVTVRFFWYV